MQETVKKLLLKGEKLECKIGIEREGLRVTQNAELSKKKHPKDFGDKLKNPYITTDFSESQVEVVTPALSDIQDVYNFLENLYDIVANEYEKELIWPQSMPCKIQGDIPISVYNDGIKGREAREYREYLIEKYGASKQLISGIHYNFSYSQTTLKKLYDEIESEKSFRDFKDNFYLKMGRQYLRYAWLIIYLLGATPNKIEDSLNIDENFAISYRNSKNGYRNKQNIYPNYNSVLEYVNSLQGFINDSIISSPKELYSQIRLKPYNKDEVLNSLIKDGINYIEYRIIDINPFERAGIAIEDLEFLELFNLFLMLEEEENYKFWQQEALENSDNIALYGLSNIKLKNNGKVISREEWALEILDKMSLINKEFSLKKDSVIKNMIEKVKNPKLTYAYRIARQEQKMGKFNFHLSLANEHKRNSYKNRFNLKGYESMELSTQILMKEAIKKGIEVSILDRDDNFISLKKGSIVEYVKQATKTSKDNYVSVVAMENKVVTKKILKENGIRVPDGYEFSNIEMAKQNIAKLISKPIVIKPKSTNFGLGISIFKDGANSDDIIEAFEIAFKFDNYILVEEFISGKEFRFLVIGDKVSGILHREPANVIGDGRKSIKELVEEKNKNPLRGKGYKKPLEKIKLDENAKLFLKQKNLNFDSIPLNDEKVYLRENSNISTGGDSIDYTDIMNDEFKKKAIECTKAIKAKICGVDMIIEDYKNADSPYGIIELNFNPAIHIHSFPSVGKERNIAKDILELLDLVPDTE